MNESFRIYIEQLRDGHVEKINEKLSADFLDIHEKDLAFEETVLVEGEAYLAENELVLHLDIVTNGLVSCIICNEKVVVKVQLNGFYYSEPLSNIKTGVFNFADVLREAILLEIPKFAECNQGHCPHREKINKYLVKNKSEQDSDEGYRPFSDLNLD